MPLRDASIVRLVIDCANPRSPLLVSTRLTQLCSSELPRLRRAFSRMTKAPLLVSQELIALSINFLAAIRIHLSHHRMPDLALLFLVDGVSAPFRELAYHSQR